MVIDPVAHISLKLAAENAIGVKELFSCIAYVSAFTNFLEIRYYTQPKECAEFVQETGIIRSSIPPAS